MRPSLACFLSACFHLGLFWLLAVAQDSWQPLFAVRFGHGVPAVSQAAHARHVPTIESRLASEPSEVTIALPTTVEATPLPPTLPASPANVDERFVLHPPVEELLRRRTARSTAVAIAPFADPVDDVRTETIPELDGRSLPPLEWGPIPEQQLPAIEDASREVALPQRGPAPTGTVTESGTAPRDAIGTNTPAGAQVDQNPSKLPANPEPIYPEELRRARIGGRVILRVAIRSDGLVDTVTVEKSSGQPALDASAVTAVQRWKFSPARRGGIPVRIEVRLPITFSIRN